MHPRDLEAFDAVMRTGGAGRAAELLGTSQPSVSRSLAALERACGFALFDRVRGRLVPTRDGRLFHAEVRRAFQGADHLRRAAARIREVGEGVVRVAALSALGNTVAARATAAFLARHPAARVSLQIRTSAAVRDLVAAGQVDLGLAADEVDTTGLESEVFATPRAVVLLPAAHPLAATSGSAVPRPLGPADLDGQRLVALSPGDTARLALDRLLAAAGAVPRVVVETPFSATAAALVARGAGLALANPLSLDRPLPPGLAEPRAFEPPIHFRALLLRSPGEGRSRLLDAYLAALREAARAAAREAGAREGGPAGPVVSRPRGQARSRSAA